MSKSPLGMQYAGQYQVQECKLITHAGVDVDLEGVLIEANVYEELFSNAISFVNFFDDSSFDASKLGAKTSILYCFK